LDAVQADIRLRASRLTFASTADIAAVVGLAAMVVVLAARTWETWGDLGVDTGYDVLAANRLAHGEWPYADFIYYYGPIGPALLAIAMLAFGAGLGPTIGVGVAIAVTIVGATYLLGRSLSSPLGGFLAAAITAPLAFAPNNFSMVLPHTFSASISVLTALVFLFAAGRYATRGTTGWLVSAAIAVGVTTLTRPEFAVAVLIAASAWLVLRQRAGLGGIREASIFGGIAALVPLVGYGIFLTQVSIADLLWKNLYPYEELSHGGNQLLEAYAPLTLGSFGKLALYAVLYAGGTVALVALAAAIGRRRALGRSELAAIVFAGAAAGAIATAIRPETVRYYLEFAYAWIPAGAVVALVILLRRYRRRSGAWDADAQLSLVLVLVLAVLGAKVYDAFLFHAPHPQLAVYAAPFAAVFLARLHMREVARTRVAVAAGASWLAFLAAVGFGLTWKDSAAESSSVSGPGGTMQELPSEAPVFRAALGWIARTTSPGQPVLLAPQLTTLYVLADRPNPLPQLSLLPGALPDVKAEQAAISHLDSASVPLIVIDRRKYAEYGHGAFGETFDQHVYAWVKRHYERAAVLRGKGSDPRTLEVWRRSS
jgi:hypothetical protein